MVGAEVGGERERSRAHNGRAAAEARHYTAVDVTSCDPYRLIVLHRQYLLASVLSLGCVSVNPMPPQVRGVQWDRYVLAQGATPGTFTTARARLRGTSNDVLPYLLRADDSRYQLNLQIKRGHVESTLTCFQQETSTGQYGCSGSEPVRSIALTEHCRHGVMVTSAGTSLAIEPWWIESMHVGFIVRRGERPVAAVDTDHQWTRPVWVDATLPLADLVAIDALAYVLNDVFAAEERGGLPFLCRDLSERRRHPR